MNLLPHQSFDSFYRGFKSFRGFRSFLGCLPSSLRKQSNSKSVSLEINRSLFKICCLLKNQEILASERAVIGKNILMLTLATKYTVYLPI